MIDLIRQMALDLFSCLLSDVSRDEHLDNNVCGSVDSYFGYYLKRSVVGIVYY